MGCDLCALKMFIESFKVESPNVKYTQNEIHSLYNYETTELVHENRNMNSSPRVLNMNSRQIPMSLNWGLHPNPTLFTFWDKRKQKRKKKHF
jgi:hypothetical protein